MSQAVQNLNDIIDALNSKDTCKLIELISPAYESDDDISESNNSISNIWYNLTYNCEDTNIYLNRHVLNIPYSEVASLLFNVADALIGNHIELIEKIKRNTYIPKE